MKPVNSSPLKMPIQIALEPVSNALNSFSLLNQVDHLSGLNTWVIETVATLTQEQRHTNRLIFEGLHDAVTPMRYEPNFPSYLHNLGELNAYALRTRVLEPLRRRFSQRVTYATPLVSTLLNDVQIYLNCVETLQDDSTFDIELQREVHTLLQDPGALQRLLLSHLEQMWKTSFIDEWRRVQTSLRWQVDMFTRSLPADTTIADIFYEFTGRHLSAEILAQLDKSVEVTLIPSWHTGRHVTIWDGATWPSDDWAVTDSIRLFFSEPPNYDVAELRSAPMKRGELRARMGALADDTRLHIIELLTQENEMQAQDIIASLDLSQSTISRHLKQLVSLGYLYERRLGDGANKTYRLSSFYLGRTAQALQQFISVEPQQGDQPPLRNVAPAQELKRFVDKDGRLTLWPPARRGDKLLILKYLADFFMVGRKYSEKEVNEELLQHMVIQDTAALRRGLCEFHFMERKADGSQYWLSTSE